MARPLAAPGAAHAHDKHGLHVGSPPEIGHCVGDPFLLPAPAVTATYELTYPEVHSGGTHGNHLFGLNHGAPYRVCPIAGSLARCE